MSGKGAPRRDLTGIKFGRLTAIKPIAVIRPKGIVIWACSCECGGYTEIKLGALISGNTKSCGCITRERLRSGVNRRTHGLTHSSEYKAWDSMRYRCANPKHKSYALYGGRGITVCDRWQVSFDNFYADMGPKPSAKHSLDRIDVNGNYEPGNCRWATWSEQRRNQRRHLVAKVRAERGAVWTELLGVTK
jgi:hypothetical protein